MEVKVEVAAARADVFVRRELLRHPAPGVVPQAARRAPLLPRPVVAEALRDEVSLAVDEVGNRAVLEGDEVAELVRLGAAARREARPRVLQMRGAWGETRGQTRGHHPWRGRC